MSTQTRQGVSRARSYELFAFFGTNAPYLCLVPELYYATGMQTLDASADRLARATKGDTEAFAGLVQAHQRLVFSIAWHFFHDPVTAEDIAQEVFVQLFQNLGGIQSEAHLVFWLRRVTTRKCIDEARRARHRQELPLDSAVPLESQADEPHNADLEQLQRLVAALPAKMRAVVTLRYQEDLEPAQIAEVLGCPVNSVKTRLQRALALLRQRMDRA